MKRSFSFRPVVADLLEARVVLSSVHPVAAEAAKGHHKASPTRVTLPLLVEGTTKETFSTGLVQTTHRLLVTSGNGVATGQDNITNSDGTSELDTATGTLKNGVTTVKTNKLFASGISQTEVGTSTTSTSSGTLQPDGTVVPGSRKAGLISTKKFTETTTQAGLGTQVIVGTSVEGRVNGQHESITNQQVTNFNGSVDQVRIITTQTADPNIVDTSKTVTHADGSVVTTTSTLRTLSGSVNGISII